LLYLADQIAGRTVFGRMTDRVPVNLLAGWTTALPVAMAVAVRAHNLAATSALVATGLCHAVAPAQDSSAGGGTAGPITALAERIGELTVIEIARTGSTNAVLVVPALASYTQPVAALRAVLRSQPSSADCSDTAATPHTAPAGRPGTELMPSEPSGKVCLRSVSGASDHRYILICR
jgi:hypothetical protein